MSYDYKRVTVDVHNVFATGNGTWQIQQYACISIGRGNCSDTNVLNCGSVGIPTACGIMPVAAVVQSVY